MIETEVIHQGNASSELSKLPEESVHLVVTSPPYWNIKDYEHDRQIGYEDTIRQYVHGLTVVMNHCYRVLKPGCRLAVNIGDVYSSADDEAYQVKPLPALLRSKMFKKSQFIPLGSIIWRKVSNTDSSGGASVLGSYGRPRNGYVSYDYEHILLFKKPGSTEKPDDWEKDEIDSERWTDLFTGHWQISGESGVDHPAPFPVEIPQRLIEMFSFSDEIVLDPFMGSGTTAIAAERMRRRWCGIDLNEEYVERAWERIESDRVEHGRPVSLLDK